MKRITRFGRYFIWSVAAATLVFCLGSLHLFAERAGPAHSRYQLDSAPEASLVYDRHNNLVLSFASEDRTNVPLDRVSSLDGLGGAHSGRSLLFQHAGMDIIGLARAAWVDLKARAVKQGGSTITQQLIRQVALTTDRNIRRKIKEALLALRVERRFDKKQDPRGVLNRIYLGNGHYGVEAAARGYFAKPASELERRRKRAACRHHPVPSVCSPRTSPNVARSRRDTVLKAMRENGAMTDDDSLRWRSPSRWRRSATTLMPRRIMRTSHHGADAAGLHFLEAVRREVMQQFGAEDVLKGGLRFTRRST